MPSTIIAIPVHKPSRWGPWGSWYFSKSAKGKNNSRPSLKADVYKPFSLNWGQCFCFIKTFFWQLKLWSPPSPCWGGGSVLLSFINLIKIRVIWEAVNQLNNFHLQMGLGDCQWRNIFFLNYWLMWEDPAHSGLSHPWSGVLGLNKNTRCASRWTSFLHCFCLCFCL